MNSNNLFTMGAAATIVAAAKKKSTKQEPSNKKHTIVSDIIIPTLVGLLVGGIITVALVTM